MNNSYYWTDDEDNATILVESFNDEVVASFSYQFIDRIMAIKLAEQRIEQLTNKTLVTIPTT